MDFICMKLVDTVFKVFNFPNLRGWYQKILLDVLFENNCYQSHTRWDVTLATLESRLAHPL